MTQCFGKLLKILFRNQLLEVKRELGDRHGVAQTLANMGMFWKARNQPDKAKELLREALTQLHPDSPDIKLVQQWLDELENPQDTSTRKQLFEYFFGLAIAIFIVINLLRGHWLIATLATLACLGLLALRWWQASAKTRPPA